MQHGQPQGRRVSDASDAPATASTVHGEVLRFARSVLGGQALATLLLMGLAVGGYRALAQEARDGGAAAVTPVATELERVKAAAARAQRHAEPVHEWHRLRAGGVRRAGG